MTKCHVRGGIGHTARDDTNEDGCWTEEDDETLQLGTLAAILV